MEKLKSKISGLTSEIKEIVKPGMKPFIDD